MSAPTTRRAALGAIRIVIENKVRLPLNDFIKADDLMAFFAERLKVQVREKGVRHDVVDAIFALGDEDDLVRLLARVEALQSFLGTDAGKNLLTAYGRADVYHTDDAESTPVPIYRGLDGWHTRAIGALAADIKWPFVGPLMGGVQRLVPRVQFVLTPPSPTRSSALQSTWKTATCSR